MTEKKIKEKKSKSTDWLLDWLDFLLLEEQDWVYVNKNQNYRALHLTNIYAYLFILKYINSTHKRGIHIKKQIVKFSY